jgi:hypothetical protein
MALAVDPWGLSICAAGEQQEQAEKVREKRGEGRARQGGHDEFLF